MAYPAFSSVPADTSVCEERISNFLLWQLAYTELYFTPTLWPDFDTAEFDKAIASFQQRERRFGRTSEQLVDKNNA